MPTGWKDAGKRYGRLDEAIAVLAPLDMEVLPTFRVPRKLSVDPRAFQANEEPLALAQKGGLEARVRSAYGKGMANALYSCLPQSASASAGQRGAGDRIAETVLVSGGAENTLGRVALAYPKRGASLPAPVSRTEAEGAMARCGVGLAHLPPSALQPFPLVAAEGERTVLVNPKSDNGFPVGGKWETPGARELCMNLAQTVRLELEKAPSVEEWMRTAEAERPYLVAVKGKAKADYYKMGKVVGAMLRFYNAFPRHMMLNMQRATQVMELHTTTILDDSSTHSGIGITLTRGGAAALVEALDVQMAQSGVAYVHVGDDSAVFVRREGAVYGFALDCSNFDLTQHADATRAVHELVRDELRRIDRISADLWYEYARSRVVVVALTLVRRWRHAGPSGMPLQSKVNDILMEVMISRMLARLPAGELREDDVAGAVESAGRSMGFVVRLEQYARVRNCSGVAAYLETVPFLFIGYYFHRREGEVQVHADIARTLAQMPYPSMKWIKGKTQELLLTEAMRLGSVVLNLGLPSAALDDMYETAGRKAVALVKEAIEKFGDVQDERLRWAVQETPWANTAESSLKGLLRALETKRVSLWRREPELLADTSFLPLAWGVPWADEVEEVESREIPGRLRAGLFRPSAQRGLVILATPKRRPSTHPATWKNDGRPPPVAVWGPPKAPRQPAAEQVGSTSRGRRRDGILAREYEAELRDELEGFYRQNASSDDDDLY